MVEHRYDNEKSIDNARKLFNGTIDMIKQILGTSAFCAYDRQNNCFMNKFSGSVYDSIMIAFSMFDNHDLMMHADEIRNKINDIKANDLQYQDYTYAATGSKDRVIGRIMIMYNALAKIIGKYGQSPKIRLFTKIDKEKLWHDHYICSYCNQEILSIDDAEVDHVIPYSKGGSTIIENAQLLHRHCNREKNNITDDDAYFEDNVDDIE